MYKYRYQNFENDIQGRLDVILCCMTIDIIFEKYTFEIMIETQNDNNMQCKLDIILYVYIYENKYYLFEKYLCLFVYRL